MKVRMLALLLTAAMLLTMVPTGTFAAAPKKTAEAISEAVETAPEKMEAPRPATAGMADETTWQEPTVYIPESVCTESDEEYDPAAADDGEDDLPPMSYISIDMPAAKLERMDEGSSTAGYVPSAYSSVTAGNVPTAARNQGQHGACWAFAANAAAEASLIAKGETVDGKTATNSNLDLSEAQLVQFFYREKVDPLGNAIGDTVTPVGKKASDRGGNNRLTLWSLAGWSNGAPESVMPYSKVDTKFSDEYAYSFDVAHMQNARIIPYDAECYYEDGVATSVARLGSNTAIKQAVMEHGAVAISYKCDQSLINQQKKNYYNNSELRGSGHAVAIVGWNDDYPASWFKITPPGNGAWLIRNSWGSNSKQTDGDAEFTDDPSTSGGAYFWMSYYELTLCDPHKNGMAFVFDFDDAGKYDFNYQYDGGVSPATVQLNSGISASAIYEIKACSKETIAAVGIGFYSTEVDYSVQLYKNPAPDDPISGEPLLASPITGRTDYEGYYTIEIPENMQPTLERGDEVSVVITAYHPDKALVAIDNYMSWGGSIESTISTKNDRTYLTYNSGYTYRTGEYDYTLRVKLYTKMAETDQPTYRVQAKDEVPVGGKMPLDAVLVSGDEYQVKSGSYKWNSTNAAVASVTGGGSTTAGTLTAKKAGTTQVYMTATLKNGQTVQSDAFTVTVTPKLSGVSFRDSANKTVSTLSLVKDEAAFDLTELLTLSWSDSTTSGLDRFPVEVSYVSASPAIASVDDRGVVTPLAAGSAKITATVTYGGQSQKGTITAKVGQGANGVTTTLSTLDVGLLVGGTKTLNAKAVIFENGKVSKTTPIDTGVIWSSSNEQVAAVDAGGKVTAIGQGYCEVRATPKAPCVGYDPADDLVFSVAVTPKLNGAALYDAAGKKLSSPSFKIVVGEPDFDLGSMLRIDVAGGEDAIRDYVTVSYSSSKVSVATVDEAGRVTPLASGSAKVTITVACGSQSKQVSVSFTVCRAADRVTTTMSSTDVDLLVGGTKTLNAKAVIFENGKVSKDNPIDSGVLWSSSDESVATVDTKGKVTAIGMGRCQIVATPAYPCVGYDPACDLVFHVTVTPKLNGAAWYDAAGKKLSSLSPTIVTGEPDYDLAAMLRVDITGGEEALREYGEVTYTSAKPAVATVDENGQVTAVAVGTAKITVNVVCGSQKKQLTATFTVCRAANAVTTTLKSMETDLLVGKNTTLNAKAVILENGKTVTSNLIDTTVQWSSSDESVATVDAKGKVVAKGLGRCSITATPTHPCVGYDRGNDLVFSVTVTPKLVSAALYGTDGKKISSPSFSLVVGEEPCDLGEMLKIELDAGDWAIGEYVDVTYTSSKESVATVSPAGVITPVANGSAKVTVDVVCGSQKKQITVSLTVYLPADTVTTTLKSTAVEMKNGKTTTLNAAAAIAGSKVKPITTGVTWEVISGSDVVSVSDKGVVTARGVGTAVVRATAVRGLPGAYLDFTVTVWPVLTKVTYTKPVLYPGESLYLKDYFTVYLDGRIATEEEVAQYCKVTYKINSSSVLAASDAATGWMQAAAAVKKTTSVSTTVTVECGSSKNSVNISVSVKAG